MKTVVVIAPGGSLTDVDLTRVKIAREEGRVSAVIAVSDAVKKAEWADALIKYDNDWFVQNNEWREFKGEVYNRQRWLRLWGGRRPPHDPKTNSGLVAMHLAHAVYEAERIILLGFDLHSEEPKAWAFPRLIEQFRGFNLTEVINCTPGSKLPWFPHLPLKEVI